MTNGVQLDGRPHNRTITTDAYDAVAISVAPSQPVGQERHNAAVSYPVHESDSHEDEEADSLGLLAEQ